MKRNYIRARDGDYSAHIGTTVRRASTEKDLPVVSTRKVDVSRWVGFAMLPLVALLAILQLPTPVMLAGGWAALAIVSVWLWLLISKVHRDQVKERAQTLETMAAFKDMVTGAHDTNLAELARRLREIERDHTQLVAVVDECVTWDHVPGGRPDEEAA